MSLNTEMEKICTSSSSHLKPNSNLIVSHLKKKKAHLKEQLKLLKQEEKLIKEYGLQGTSSSEEESHKKKKKRKKRNKSSSDESHSDKEAHHVSKPKRSSDYNKESRESKREVLSPTPKIKMVSRPRYSELKYNKYEDERWIRSSKHNRSRSPDHHRERSRSPRESRSKYNQRGMKPFDARSLISKPKEKYYHISRSPPPYHMHATRTYKHSRPRSPYYDRGSRSPESDYYHRKMKSKLERDRKVYSYDKSGGRSYRDDREECSRKYDDYESSRRIKTEWNLEDDPQYKRNLKIAQEKLISDFDLIVRDETVDYTISSKGKQYLSDTVRDIVISRFTQLSITWWDGKDRDELVDHYRKDHSIDDDKKLVKKLISECTSTEHESEEGEVADTEGFPIGQTSDIDTIWNAVDKALEDVKVEEFKACEDEDNLIGDLEATVDNNIQATVEEEAKEVPENPQFVTPIHVLMRKIKKKIEIAESDCKYAYHVARKVIQDRLKEIMVGEDYTRTCLIVKKYREIYNVSDDDEFLQKICDDIKNGKHELFTMELELNKLPAGQNNDTEKDM